VNIGIFDMCGRMIETIDQGNRPAGTYRLQWNPDLPAGYYVCRLVAGNQTTQTGLVKTR
jgi:hypothetical protein